MEIFWFIIIAIVFAVFFILDGYDFGVGIIHLFLAKKEKDKEVIAKSAGLFWDSNEVWMVAGGGLMFMAFPVYYSSIFSGFYLPLIFILWLIIFRAIGLELRGQFNFQMWKDVWDRAFGVSSLLLTLFFGIALGNVIRGVNLGGVEQGVSKYEPHFFFLPLWDSSFSPTSVHPGVIDWFTLIVGIMSVVALAIHGANWIVLKTNSSINLKLKDLVFKLAIVLFILSLMVVIGRSFIDDNLFKNFINYPLFIAFPMIYYAGIGGCLSIKKMTNDKLPFLFSCMIVLGGIATALASLFPVILPSTNDTNPALTIYNTTTSDYGLSTAVSWGVLGFILIFVYLIIQKRMMSGKIDDMDYGSH